MMLRLPARARILGAMVALAALLPQWPAMTMVDGRIGWTLLSVAEPIVSDRGLVVDLDAAVAESDGTSALSRKTLAALINAIADAGIDRVFVDASFSLPRQPEETEVLAAAFARFGADRIGVLRPGVWRDRAILVRPEFAPHVTVLQSDQPVGRDGWVSQIGRSQPDGIGLPVAPRWLARRADARPVTIHPAAKPDGFAQVRASSILRSPGILRQSKASWAVVANGPDMPGQRSILRQGPLTRGQAVALATATIEADREPVQLIPWISSLACTLLAAAMAWTSRLRLAVAGPVLGLTVVAVILVGFACADVAAMVIPVASLLVSAVLSCVIGLLLAESRALPVRAALMAAAGAPIPGWRAFRSDLDPAILTDRDGTILAANASARSLLHGTTLRGRPVAEIFGPELAARVVTTSTPDGPLMIPLQDGALWIEAVVSPVQGDPALRCVVTLRDVTPLQAASQALSQRVETDPLTGVLNRLGLTRRLEATTGDLVVFLIDLDGFKPVNDRFGHAAGDAVLRAIGARLGALPGLTAARLGGDEFAVLAPAGGAPPAEIAAALETLIQQPEPHGDVMLAVGASIGWAHSPHPHRSADAILHAADLEMYRVKQLRSLHRRRDSADAAAA